MRSKIAGGCQANSKAWVRCAIEGLLALAVEKFKQTSAMSTTILRRWETAVSAHDFYENALGEMINGLFKTEATHSNAPWRILEEVEFALLKSVDWFNHR